jgi:hypothetical protein
LARELSWHLPPIAPHHVTVSMNGNTSSRGYGDTLGKYSLPTPHGRLRARGGRRCRESSSRESIRWRASNASDTDDEVECRMLPRLHAQSADQANHC